MPDVKISGLPAAAAAVAAQEIPVAESGTTRKVTVAQVVALDGQMSSVFNASIAPQSPTGGTDTYVTDSRCPIPAATGMGSLKVRSMYRVKFHIAKTTAAGTGSIVVTVRFGAAGTTADAAVGQITFAVQTAVADEGFIEIFCTLITVGSGTSATLRPVGVLAHRLAATGLSTSNDSDIAGAVGAGFNSQLASGGIGISINTGTSTVATITGVQAELYNLA